MGGTARGPGLGSAARCVRRKTGRPFPPPGVGRLCVPARRARDSVLWPGCVRREAGRPLPPPGVGQLCVPARRARGLALWPGCVRRETGRPLPPPGVGRPRVPARRGQATGGGRAAPRHCLRRYVPCAPRHCLRQHVPCAPRHCLRQHVPCAPQHCLRQHVPCAPRPPQASVRTRSRPWSHQPKRAPIRYNKLRKFEKRSNPHCPPKKKGQGQRQLVE